MKDDLRDRRLLEIAEKIAEGARVDWSDPATTESVLGPLAAELKLLDAVAAHWREAESHAAPAEPPRLPGYEIIRELGSGGAGVVYLARDLRLERMVAIKTLPADVALEPERLAQVEREAKLLASLNHPHIATIHGIGECAGGSRVLLLEYVEGETLAERLRGGALPISEALATAGQIAEALEVAHVGGIIHRDLKPGNVMTGLHGRIKVLDFGLARRRGSEGGEREYPISGTWAYLSPECLTRSEDHRADVFAFGCVLYECLTGHRAFPGKSADETLGAVMGRDPDWTLLPADTPHTIRLLLEQCLAKDPEPRPSDMGRVRRIVAEAVRASGEPWNEPAATIVPGLPRPATSFIGRGRELMECSRLLQDARLVSLTGPGGSGKTRMAVEVAAALHERFTGGIHFVDLAPSSDQARVPEVVAAVLGVQDGGVASLTDRIGERLREGATLVVLDNCEHLLQASAELVRILIEQCPKLEILVTSREPLGLELERRIEVGPLELPAERDQRDSAAIARSEAVRLFIDRAKRSDPGFSADSSALPLIVEICRRVDALPLAIELAAARASVLSPSEIALRLDHQLQLLRSATGRPVGRHETIRATIAWSVDQLTLEESRVFRSLAALAGGCDLEAAMSVCDAKDEFEMLDGLSSLVNRSLLSVERRAGEESRYRFLEPIRQFALERLVEHGEETAARARHLAYFVALGERAITALYGPDQGTWLRRLSSDMDNFLAALKTSESAQGGTESALRILSSLHRMWVVRGLARFAVGAYERVFSHEASDVPPLLRGRALQSFARLLHSHDAADRSRVSRALEEALEIHRDAGDERGMVGCLVILGQGAAEERDFATAQIRFEAALETSRKIGYQAAIVSISQSLGITSWMQGDFAAALGRLEEAQRIQRASPSTEDRSNTAVRAASIAYLSMRQGNRGAARRALAEALEYYLEVGAVGGTMSTVLLGAADYLEDAGASEVAALLYGAEEELSATHKSETRWRALFGGRREEMLARFEEVLGAERLAAALARGRATAPGDAIRLAQEALKATPTE